MVYECEQCDNALPAGVFKCPKCGESFDEAVPQDAEVSVRGWQPKSKDLGFSAPTLQSESKIPFTPKIVISQEHHPAPPAMGMHTSGPKSQSGGTAPFDSPFVVTSAGQTNPKRRSKAYVIWCSFLILLSIGAFVSGCQGDMTGYGILFVLGGPTLWFMRQWTLRSKLRLAAIWLVAALIFGIYSQTPMGKAAYAAKTHDENVESQREAQQKQKDDQQAAEKQKQTDKEAAAAANPTPEDQMKKLMQDKFGDNLKDVEVDKLDSGGYGIVVNFKAKGSFTNHMEKDSIEIDMKEAYKDLYTSNLGISKANMNAYGTAQDNFGKESEVPIYETSMTSDIGKKINWDNYLTLDFSQLWDVGIVNPSLQQ